MEIVFKVQLQLKSGQQKMVQLRSDEKLLSIDGEKRFFHIKVTFLNLRNPQSSTEGKKMKLKCGNLFGNLQKAW